MSLELFAYSWLVIGLLGYIVGLIVDLLLYKRSVRNGLDISVLLLCLTLGPLTWILVITSIIGFAAWKRRKKNNGQE